MKCIQWVADALYYRRIHIMNRVHGACVMYSTLFFFIFGCRWFLVCLWHFPVTIYFPYQETTLNGVTPAGIVYSKCLDALVSAANTDFESLQPTFKECLKNIDQNNSSDSSTTPDNLNSSDDFSTTPNNPDSSDDSSTTPKNSNSSDDSSITTNNPNSSDSSAADS